MAEAKFLVVRLSSLGDIVHNLPAVGVLRDAFQGARIDWLIDRKWAALLHGNADVSEVIALDRRSWRAGSALVGRLRSAGYTCAIDFQGLYKSALLAFLCGAPRRVGFSPQEAREAGAAFFYTDRVTPAPGHKVMQNIALAEAAGARAGAARFPLRISAQAQAAIAGRLRAHEVGEYFVVSPGGGWKSKCWPPERYGEVCREVARSRGWRAVVNHGPGEEEIAAAVRRAATPAEPVLLSTDVPELMALLGRAKLIVAGDTGPMHLAVALGTPAVALYGPTNPARNGPYSAEDIVVCNARPEEITYKRGREYSASMLSISVEQVLAAIERRLARSKLGVGTGG